VAKSLKVSDNIAGKRVRCPGCKNPFVVPEDAPVLELVDEEEEQEERVTARPRPATERRPKGRRDDDEEDDEEDERPRPRRRPRDSGSYSKAPLVYGILSCLFSCWLVVGIYFGWKAVNGANEELDRLPGGKRFRDARKQLQLAKTIGVIGMCLSGVMCVVVTVWQILNLKK
jgi:hypothetical protein